MEKEYKNNSYTNTLLKTVMFSLKITAVIVFLFLPAISQSALSGGGNGPIFNSPNIFNENITYIKSNEAFLSWETDKPATSRVMYGTKSQKDVIFASDANNINHGYDFSTNQSNELTTKHKVIVSGLAPNIKYFFRPESRVNNYARLGREITNNRTSTKNRNTTKCNYINKYLKIGSVNDPEEILKLQTFLRDSEGFTSIKMTGVFDQATFKAVSAFQTKYADEILTPWGIASPTGFVYFTTQKKINEIHCGKILSLTKSQLDKINQTRSSLKLILSDNRQQRSNNFENIIKKKDTGSDDNLYSDKDNDNKIQVSKKQTSLQASVVKTKIGFVRSIFNSFIGLFR